MPKIVTPLLMIAGVAGPMVVRYLPAGARYGRKNVLIADGPLVEFYDARCADDSDGDFGQIGDSHDRDGTYGFGPLGQFVSRYNVTSILGRPRGYGLDLMGYEPAWKIEAAEMAKVEHWLAVWSDIPGAAKVAA